MKIGTLCYIKKGGKTLMMHRIKNPKDMHKGKWVGLGGKMEKGESPEECVAREVREESGLDISDPKLKGFITFPEDIGIEDWYVFVFRADNFTGELKNESHEGTLEWVDDKAMETIDMWEGDRIFQKLVNKDGIFSAKFEYKEGVLTGHNICEYK